MQSVAIRTRTETYHGRPCKRGHGTLRYRASYGCVVCAQDAGNKMWGKKSEDRRARNLKQNYGISTEEYNAMSVAQDGKCALCGDSKSFHSSGRLVVDHCHGSGKVRALLCSKCNLGLGGFDDSEEKLKAAIEYLRRF